MGSPITGKGSHHRQHETKTAEWIYLLSTYTSDNSNKCMNVAFLLGMQILRGSPVYPGRQTHAMSCCWAVQSAFTPQLEIKHASTQVPVWHTSLERHSGLC
jgi:hypothetical protein